MNDETSGEQDKHSKQLLRQCRGDESDWPPFSARDMLQRDGEFPSVTRVGCVEFVECDQQP